MIIMRNLSRFLFVSLFLLISIDGIGQTKEMPIISKIVNSYLDTLLKDKELSPSDTLLLTNNFDIESRFLKTPNFKKLDNYDLNGEYLILRFYLDELKDKNLKIKIQINSIRYIKLNKKGTPSAEDLNSQIYEYYWITYDCDKNEWIIIK